MAELEYKGIKLGGSKLILILPLIGTLLSGGWAIFNLYDEFLDLRKAVKNYTAPNLTGINQAIAVLETDSKALTQVVTEQVNSLKETVSLLQGQVFDVKLELKQDLSDMNDRLETQISRQSDNLDQQEIRNRDNVNTVRDIISSFETRMNSKIDFLDTKIDTLETELDEKIKLNLSNPLNQ